MLDALNNLGMLPISHIVPLASIFVEAVASKQTREETNSKVNPTYEHTPHNEANVESEILAPQPPSQESQTKNETSMEDNPIPKGQQP